jgi:two-component system, NtrC family, sensor histidine kinase HydH
VHPSDALTAAACAGQLALALLCIARAIRSPLAVPLALLCLDIFGWTASGLAFDLSGVEAWRWLDHALTPLTAPLALQFILVFVGRRRALRVALGAVSVASGALGLASALAFMLPSFRPFIGSPAWALSFFAVVIPAMALALTVLAWHLRGAEDLTERSRARILFAAFGLATPFVLTGELGGLGVPPLESVGLLISTALLSVVALRFRLLERDLSLRAVGYALGLTGVAAIVALIVLRTLGENGAVVLLGSTTLSLALLAAGRQWLAETAIRRERQAHLATLGRFGAQISHDLKNPLAALKGAAQLLAEDIARPAPGLDRIAFVRLMLDQIARLEGLVDVYGRLARVEPVRTPIDLNEVARGVLAFQSLVVEGIAVNVDLGGDLPLCRADRDLVARVIENVVRNAFEAMPGGGAVTIRTAAERLRGKERIVLSVADTGGGMDARTRERAFDDFFTTKALGSGLGLAFVRRIVEAHGGDVSLESTLGRGTVVSVRLPVA